MARFRCVPPIVLGLDFSLTGRRPPQFEEYLDVAAGVKEIHLHNAFTDVAFSDKATSESDEEPSGPSYSSKTPPERTGGGW
jgi:hypothetical protein